MKVALFFYAFLSAFLIYGYFIEATPVQSCHASNLHGRSMEQYGLYDGMKVSICSKDNIEVGDIVSFRCNDEKKCPTNNMVKKLTYKGDGCYWFQGRDDEWIDENGQKERSWDSRIYGLVCKDEITINGVLKE